MTDQEKREKVIKGLECCDGYCDDETGCPYDELEAFDCQEQLRADAIALLKAQEARVMTLDEAKSAFVIEYRSGKLKEAGMTILDLDVDPANAHYGVIYRVWTSRPTDEQREKEKWK